MNREDKQRVIGKVVAINSDRFTVELLSGIDNFNVSGFDDIHYFAQLNSFVIIPYQNYYIISEVVSVREKDLNASISNVTDQILSKAKYGKYLEVVPVGSLKLKEGFNDVYDFSFGISVYPALYSDTLYIKESELDSIFNVKDQEAKVCFKHKTEAECDCTTKRYKTLSIGKSTIFPDYSIKIDIDKFWGNHAAILGNTGSGKSCTISSMLQEIYKKESFSANGSTFIFFDVNGEYGHAFSEISETNKDVSVAQFSFAEEAVITGHKVLTLPHWFFNFDEWCLLLQATEKTHQPVLRNALNFASLLENEGVEVSGIINHIVAKCCISLFTSSDSPVSVGHRVSALLRNYASGELSPTLLSNFSFNWQYGNFNPPTNKELFMEQLKAAVIEDFEIPNQPIKKFKLDKIYEYLDLAILYEESFGNKQIRDYCSSLLTRAKSITERRDLNFLNGDYDSKNAYCLNLLGLNEKDSKITKENQIIIIDLSMLEDEVIEIISCVLSRIIYETIKQVEPRNSYPVNLVLEEAHRYISNDTHRTFLKANKIFEQIAKEGRKFGMLLLISSQRPSELSKTVLSQCSNFIVHRIQNPEDLSHIRQITPHIPESILKQIPSIPTQHALIFGHAVNLPTTFKVNDAYPRPKSDNNKISENWFKPKDHEVTVFKR